MQLKRFNYNNLDIRAKFIKICFIYFLKRVFSVLHLKAHNNTHLMVFRYQDNKLNHGYGLSCLSFFLNRSFLSIPEICLVYWFDLFCQFWSSCKLYNLDHYLVHSIHLSNLLQGNYDHPWLFCRNNTILFHLV